MIKADVAVTQHSQEGCVNQIATANVNNTTQLSESHSCRRT